MKKCMIDIIRENMKNDAVNEIKEKIDDFFESSPSMQMSKKRIRKLKEFIS